MKIALIKIINANGELDIRQCRLRACGIIFEWNIREMSDCVVRSRDVNAH